MYPILLISPVNYVVVMMLDINILAYDPIQQNT